VGDELQGAAGDCNSPGATHAWFDSRVAHHFHQDIVFPKNSGYSVVQSRSKQAVFLHISGNFRYTGDEKRVRYLKIDRGRCFNQRRVPQDLQALLGPRWLIPCGDATFAKADRLTHHCHLLETGIDSFRFKAGSAAAARKKNETNPPLTLA